MAKNSFGWDNWTGTGVNNADSLAAEIDRIKKWQRTHSGIDFAAAGPDYPHPSQKVRALYFFEGNGRLDPTGIQIVDDVNETVSQRGIYWVEEFTDTPNDAETSAAVLGNLFTFGGGMISQTEMKSVTPSSGPVNLIVQSSDPVSGEPDRITGTIGTDQSFDLLHHTGFSAIFTLGNDTALRVGNMASDPTGGGNGNMWYRTGDHKLRARINGSNLSLATEAYVTAAIPTTMNRAPFAAKTTTYTTTANDGVITADATSASFTVTLVTAVGNSGLTQTFKKINADNVVTIDANGGELVDGLTTYALSAQWSFVTLVSTGSGWIIVAQG